MVSGTTAHCRAPPKRPSPTRRSTRPPSYMEDMVTLDVRDDGVGGARARGTGTGLGLTAC
jgi:hypothetical protein